jgi:hypothetical protein
MTRTWSLSLLRFSSALLALSLLFSNLLLDSAHASRGGVEDLNNKFTVGFTYKDGPIPSVCSGILIAPTIIATARHCVRSDDGVDGTDYVFTNPGAALDGLAAVAKVSRIAISDEDLAFIILDTPLKGASYLRIADSMTVFGLTDLEPLYGYGYGAVFETASPYSKFVRKYSLEWRSTGKDLKLNNTYELISKDATACRGDSGGPITMVLPSGEMVLIAVVTGAANVQDGCGTRGSDGLYRMRVTLVSPYLGLVPEYTGVPAAAPAPTKKVIKIICVKGKVKKVVTGVKPKCPKGYVKQK